VASVLEGSVRRSGHTIRVTAQLNNATTGFHIWSQTYDRDLGDVLQLQTEIATVVAEALKIKLLGDTEERIELGGTRNPAAYDAYLRSASAYWQASSASENESVRAGYQEAVRLDPNFALAYAGWSLALGGYAGRTAPRSAAPGAALHGHRAGIEISALSLKRDSPARWTNRYNVRYVENWDLCSSGRTWAGSGRFFETPTVVLPDYCFVGWQALRQQKQLLRT
jgi:hypothetical protein